MGLGRAAENDGFLAEGDDGAFVRIPVDDEGGLAGEAFDEGDHEADGTTENEGTQEAAADFAEDADGDQECEGAEEAAKETAEAGAAAGEIGDETAEAGAEQGTEQHPAGDLSSFHQPGGGGEFSGEGGGGEGKQVLAGSAGEETGEQSAADEPEGLLAVPKRAAEEEVLAGDDEECEEGGEQGGPESDNERGGEGNACEAGWGGFGGACARGRDVEGVDGFGGFTGAGDALEFVDAAVGFQSDSEGSGADAVVLFVMMDLDDVVAGRCAACWPVDVFDGFFGIGRAGVHVHVEFAAGGDVFLAEEDVFLARGEAVEVDVVAIVPHEGNLHVAGFGGFTFEALGEFVVEDEDGGGLGLAGGVLGLGFYEQEEGFARGPAKGAAESAEEREEGGLGEAMGKFEGHVAEGTLSVGRGGMARTQAAQREMESKFGADFSERRGARPTGCRIVGGLGMHCYRWGFPGRERRASRVRWTVRTG